MHRGELADSEQQKTNGIGGDGILQLGTDGFTSQSLRDDPRA
jgi:hypothetical protein